MKRRVFIQTACVAGAVTLIDGPEMFAQNQAAALEKGFQNPPFDAGLSVVHHWTGGVATKEGITADIEGMAASGINTVNWFFFDGTGVSDGIQLYPCKSPQWWELADHLLSEAKRLNMTVAPHVCSSWGPAGTDLITPELSQQQLVWSEVDADGGQPFTPALARPIRPAGRGRGGPTFPPAFSNYYRDLAVLAFPVPADWGETSVTRKATVTASLPITDLAKAADPANNERVVDTGKAGWIQFAFDQPFTLRAVTVNPGGGVGGASQANPYLSAHSMEVHASDDGTTFHKIGQCEPMNNGWQTTVSTLTHTVKQTTARYFRLVYTPRQPLGYDEGMRTGTRQGGGDFKNMVEPLGFFSIVLSTTPTVHLLAAKNSASWGRGRLVTDEEIPASACVPVDSIVDLTARLREDGTLGDWTPPAGKWRVERFGYMSQMVSTGGGLQADKYSADAARLVFEGWFREIRKRRPDADKIVKILNIDSWENGPQNWSPVLPEEFSSRRGYDLTRYLPAMTGVMVGSGGTTEGFLLDLRRTMSECLADNFYGTLCRLAHEAGAIVQSEVVNPAMNVDGMQYFKGIDWTGGEFWVRAAQNWKPNDIADGVAGARIYGKKIIFAEAFTGGGWQDHPFALKAMGDHNYAEGLNRMMLHVWNAQYYPHRLPGQPGAGTPFHNLNTWWKAGQGWRDYMRKAQALLQQGQPVEDALYYAGENLPCRSILSPKLDWVWAADPALPEGYKHTTVNRDGLLNLAKVENGRIVVSGLSYRVLILRGGEPYLTPAVAARIKELVEAGAVVVGPKPLFSPSLEQGAAGQAAVKAVAEQLWGKMDGKTITENKFGKGRVFWGKPMADVLAAVGVTPDVTFAKVVDTATGNPVVANANAPDGANPVLVGEYRKGWGLEFCHRQGQGFDLYFVSNQEYFAVSEDVSFRAGGKVPEFWDAETGKIEEAPMWREQNGRTIIPMDFTPSGSMFVLFRKAAAGADPVTEMTGPKRLRMQKTAAGLDLWAPAAGSWTLKTRAGKTIQAKAENVSAPIDISGVWNVSFPVKGSAKQVELPAGSWSSQSDEDVKFFSGTATYKKEFTVPAAQKAADKRLYLDLGEVHNLARVRLNGKDLGVLWKAPYVVDITAAAAAGVNRLELEVTNTWVNRLIGDAGKPPEQRVTFSGGGGGTLLPAGLIGPVRVTTEVKVTPAAG